MKALNQKYFFIGNGFATLLFCFITGILSGQTELPKKDKKVRFIAYPVGYYSPETRIGVGLASTFNFRTNHNDTISPVSQISLGGGITQNNQAAFSLPFTLFFNERKHTLSGEFSYNDFSYHFYGTGSGNYRGDFSDYHVRFPLFRLNYLRKIQSNLYAGMRWWYEDYRISSFDQNPALDSHVPGKNGSTTSGPGIVLMFDQRDNIYYSTRGSYLELSWQTQSNLTGSNFYYDRYRFDFRNFIPLNEQISIASNLFGDFIAGDVPFSQMPAMGSGRRARGYYQGRFRDKNLLLYQGELRGKLDPNWAVAAFWNYGILSQRFNDFNFKNDHASVGFGFRYAFDKSNRSNLRLDLAWPLFNGDYLYDPDNTLKVYFTVNEAF